MSWHHTDWKFVTSETGELTYGPVGATGGNLFVTCPKVRRNVVLSFFAMGAGLSGGIPVAADMSLPELPGGGIGPIWGNGTRKLGQDSFGGVCAIVNAQFAGLEFSGRSVAVVFMGIRLDPRLRGPIAPNLYLEARAVGFILGQTVGLQALSAGFMGYLGYLW